MEPAVPGSRSLRTAALLVVATIGLALNLRAWILLGPLLAQRNDVRLGEYLMLLGVPLLVAGVLRLPVGVLTDRYGARTMFPAVSLVAAGSVIGLGLAGSVPVIVAAGAVAGAAGTAFVVGATLVARTVGYGRRGLALGVFTIGSALAVLISAWSWKAAGTPRWCWPARWSASPRSRYRCCATRPAGTAVPRRCGAASRWSGWRPTRRCHCCTRSPSAGSWRSRCTCPPT